MNNVLVTGGAGFIGSNFIRLLFDSSDFSGNIINLDLLTYAGNAYGLNDVQEKAGKRYTFVHGSIGDRELLFQTLKEYEVDTVVHFAAESHVDRSIVGPDTFIQTNIIGTFTVLETIRAVVEEGKSIRLHHVSTDEVYGSLGESGYFTEDSAYDPRSPYAASKASSDHLVRAYGHTYDLPFTISNCSNNYGPYQFPEKLIPLMILNILNEKELPVYGDGMNVRDWIHVDDHNRGLLAILKKGRIGETYNLGGRNEWTNLELTKRICRIMAKELLRHESKVLDLISFVKDRPGHDRRYAIDCSKAEAELGWENQFDFDMGLRHTILWYLSNLDWIRSIQSGEYKQWIEKNYGKR